MKKKYTSTSPRSRSTRNSIIIKASPEKIYGAFTEPTALGIWLAPGEMTGKVQNFNLKVEGGYQMSLFYPETEKESRGKTNAKEDRFNARFIELTPPHKIVEAINFESADPAFSGEMIMTVTIEAIGSGTRVTIVFTNIPGGVSLEDNKKGTQLSLQKLARYVE